MTDDGFKLGVRGPDADDLVWPTFEGAAKRGVVRIGRSADPSSSRAISTRSNGEALQREFGHLVHAPA